MSDENTAKRPRSPINALKVLNELREAKGLPKVTRFGAKPKRIVLSKEQKAELAKAVWTELYPASVQDQNFVVSETAIKAVNREYEARLKRLQSGK
jgi:hypothetical protein